MSAPVSRALAKSKYAAAIKLGLQAVAPGNRARIEEALRKAFGDSVDLDTATQSAPPEDHRWDYLLGHSESAQVVALEIHPASTSDVRVVIAKRKAALRHLRGQLATGHRVAAWYWAASGKIAFVPFDKMKLLLDQEGISFVGEKLRAKDLATSTEGKAARAKRRR